MSNQRSNILLPRKGDTVGQWARSAKVSVGELIKYGPEVVQDNIHPGKAAQRMPDWVFYNDFEGQPPLNPTEELSRMDKELTAVIGDLDRMIKRGVTPPKRSGTTSIGADQITADIVTLLDRVQQQDPPKSNAKQTKKDDQGKS